VKADYYTVSGKKMKTAEMVYDNRVQTKDGARPFVSRITIRDVLMTEDATTLEFSDPVLREVPNSVLDVNQLAR